jgi:hypothetical protein
MGHPSTVEVPNRILRPLLKYLVTSVPITVTTAPAPRHVPPPVGAKTRDGSQSLGAAELCEDALQQPPHMPAAEDELAVEQAVRRLA